MHVGADFETDDMGDVDVGGMIVSDIAPKALKELPIPHEISGAVLSVTPRPPVRITSPAAHAHAHHQQTMHHHRPNACAVTSKQSMRHHLPSLA